MNTTQTKTALVPLWWKAWIAILLIMFGVPSLFARLVMLGGDESRLDLLGGATLSSEALARVEESRRRAAAWFPENTLLNDLALVALNKAGRTDNEQATAFLREAEMWERRALAVSPADPFGWYRLSYLFYAADGGPTDRAVAAWRQSMATGPYEYALIFPRLEMAVALGDRLGEGDQAYVQGLIRAAWKDHPDRLAKLAMDGTYLTKVEEALANDADDLAAFREKTTRK